MPTKRGIWEGRGRAKLPCEGFGPYINGQTRPHLMERAIEVGENDSSAQDRTSGMRGRP